MSQGQSATLPPHSHLTPKEIAVFLRVNQRTVYRLYEESELPFPRWGHVIRIPVRSSCADISSAGKGSAGKTAGGLVAFVVSVNLLCRLLLPRLVDFLKHRGATTQHHYVEA